MKRHIRPIRLVAVASIALAVPASAAVSMEWVTIGNPGNATDPSTGYGTVATAYNIGKYEVTNSQYADFLNTKGSSNANGIYNAGMASYGITQDGVSGGYTYSVSSGFENKPVVLVSWFDAARFSNWLGNGQGSGSMETGAYTLNNATSGIITINSGTTISIPSEDQWYKAAYYNGTIATYTLYPTNSDSITTGDANYNTSGSTNVGSYAKASAYGTFDQGGNAWEWNDAVIGSSRVLRGGSWNFNGGTLQSSARTGYDPAYEFYNIGFRVASVPEPTSLILTMFASGVMLVRRKR